MHAKTIPGRFAWRGSSVLRPVVASSRDQRAPGDQQTCSPRGSRSNNDHRNEATICPSGKSRRISISRRHLQGLNRQQRRCATETIFRRPIKLIWPVQSRRQKYSAFPKSNSVLLSRHLPLAGGAVRGRHGRGAGGAVDAMAAQRIFAPTNADVAYGQVAWSWHPDADAPTVARPKRVVVHGDQNARRTGENAKQPLRPSAQGGPGCPSRTCGTCRLHFLSQAGHGGGRLPAFPAPLVFQGATGTQSSGVIRRENAPSYLVGYCACGAP